MEVRFKREMNHNYMIIDAPEEAGSYECRMMAGNEIEGLLKFRVRHYEEKKEFYYEITSKQPLSRLLEQRKIKGEEIRSLLLAVFAILNRIEEFLLKEEELLLEPDYIYVEPDHFSACLCLIPGRSGDLPAALSGLLQFLLERVDHQDKEGVVLAYNLYHESLKENYGAGNLLRQLLPENDKIFLKERGAVIEDKKRSEGIDFVGGKEDQGYHSGSEPERDWKEEKRRKPERFGRDYMEEEEVRPRETVGALDYKSNKKKENEMAGGKKKGDEKASCEKARYERRVVLSGKENRNKAEKRLSARTEKRKGGLQYLAAAAGTEMLIWYLAGEEGLRQYGIWAPIGFLAVWLLAAFSAGRAAQSGGRRSEKRASASGRAEMETKKEDKKQEPELWEAQESSVWEMEAESQEEYQKRMLLEDEARMNRAKEEGTVLLASLEKAGAIAVLENLGRDGDPIEIPYAPFVIGKHRELSDYCLLKPAVSRLHLRIDRREGVFIVTDLNSTNGTTVNGYLLQANETVSIKTGDVIFIADIGFKFSENNIL